jgi:hypothetical protein
MYYRMNPFAAAWWAIRWVIWLIVIPLLAAGLLLFVLTAAVAFTIVPIAYTGEGQKVTAHRALAERGAGHTAASAKPQICDGRHRWPLPGWARSVA